MATVLLGLAPAVAACGDPQSAGGSEPGTSESPTGRGTGSDSGSASPDGGSTGTTAAPGSYAVDPPGDYKPPNRTADLLVVTKDPLTEAQLASLKDLPRVSAVEPFSLVEVPIENQLIKVAAVNPRTFRNWTTYPTPQSQDVWDRIAGGELGLDPALRKRMPVDKEGFLRLGSQEDSARVHVGAYAPLVPGSVDAVVNSAWGSQLGIPEGNAVLLSTGGFSPDDLRGPVLRIVGTSASVQRLDAVARFGLDPQAVQTAVVVGSVADAVGTFRYRVEGGRVIPDAAWASSHIATEVVPILGSVTCNRAIFPQLRAALEEVVSRGLASAIHPQEYAGCYYPRFIAGTTTLSNHAFGLALDLNVPGNQRGTVGEMNRDVVEIFEDWGFAWGGYWRYTDPMHFEMDRLVNPG